MPEQFNIERIASEKDPMTILNSVCQLLRKEYGLDVRTIKLSHQTFLNTLIADAPDVPGRDKKNVTHIVIESNVSDHQPIRVEHDNELRCDCIKCACLEAEDAFENRGITLHGVVVDREQFEETCNIIGVPKAARANLNVIEIGRAASPNSFRVMDVEAVKAHETHTGLRGKVKPGQGDFH